MDTKIVVIVTVLSVIIIVSLVYLLTSKQDNKPTLIDESIFGLFEASNIVNVDFVRNKLVVSFKDVSLFDVNQLQEFGGKGISVIGDKIKFFISEKSKENEKLYQDLLKRIER